MTPAIITTGLGKRYGSVAALHGVDLAVDPGRVLGLLGPNGAGKTTLLRILATLVPPDEGRATITALDVADDAGAVREVIGLVGQTAAVDGVLSGRENLELVGRLRGLDATTRRDRADALLHDLGLDHAADRPTATYSGGMRRRLDIASTIVVAPAVLLLDEPTTGLDPTARLAIWATVRALADARTSVVISSQHLEELDHLADEVLVLDRGQIIARGAPTELKAAVGGDVVEVVVAGADGLERATALVRATGTAPRVDVNERRITIPTTDPTQTLLTVGRVLDEAGVAIEDLGRRSPSLDDVFLALTGAATTEAVADQEDHAPLAHALRLTAATRGHKTSVWSDIAALTQRELQRIVRNPQVLVMSMVPPIFFVLVIRAVFGGALTIPGFDGDYVTFLLPGSIVMSVLLSVSATSVGVAEDRAQGIADRIRSMPVARVVPLAARTNADLLRNILVVTSCTIVALLIGFRPEAAVWRVVAGGALTVAFGYAVTWVYVAVGSAAPDIQSANLLAFMPPLLLSFLSSNFVPVETMPGWLQPVARNQPATKVIDATRALMLGGPAGRQTGVALAWIVVVLVVGVLLAVRAAGRARPIAA